MFQDVSSYVLIETYWNVKEEFHQTQIAVQCINRNILECKERKVKDVFTGW